MHWQHSTQISSTLEAVFQRILTQRMQDMPLLNSALQVQALDFQEWQAEWLGILITPWFMNLILLPGAHSDGWQAAVGSSIQRQFPYGSFDFTLADDAEIGRYAQCSLFSPMFQFTEQQAAVEAGQAALQTLLATPQPRSVSRRELLRGFIGGGEDQ
jgi:[NiFe] hydrogenase assembly HybE family chaperone